MLLEKTSPLTDLNSQFNTVRQRECVGMSSFSNHLVPKTWDKNVEMKDTVKFCYPQDVKGATFENSTTAAVHDVHLAVAENMYAREESDTEAPMEPLQVNNEPPPTCCNQG